MMAALQQSLDYFPVGIEGVQQQIQRVGDAGGIQQLEANNKTPRTIPPGCFIICDYLTSTSILSLYSAHWLFFTAHTRKCRLPEGPRQALERSSETSAAPCLVAGITIEEAERELIKSTLATVEGNREEAAKMLGIGERTLYRKLDQYGLK